MAKANRGRFGSQTGWLRNRRLHGEIGLGSLGKCKQGGGTSTIRMIVLHRDVCATLTGPGRHPNQAASDRRRVGLRRRPTYRTIPTLGCRFRARPGSVNENVSSTPVRESVTGMHPWETSSDMVLPPKPYQTRQHPPRTGVRGSNYAVRPAGRTPESIWGTPSYPGSRPGLGEMPSAPAGGLLLNRRQGPPDIYL